MGSRPVVSSARRSWWGIGLSLLIGGLLAWSLLNGRSGKSSLSPDASESAVAVDAKDLPEPPRGREPDRGAEAEEPERPGTARASGDENPSQGTEPPNAHSDDAHSGSPLVGEDRTPVVPDGIEKVVKLVGSETTSVVLRSKLVSIEDGTEPERKLLSYEPVLFELEVSNPSRESTLWSRNFGTAVIALELLLEDVPDGHPVAWRAADPAWRPFGAEVARSGTYAPGERFRLFRSYSHVILHPSGERERLNYLCQTVGTRRAAFALFGSGAVVGNPMAMRVEAPQGSDREAMEFLRSRELASLLDLQADFYVSAANRSESVADLQAFLERYRDSRYGPWAQVSLLRLLLAEGRVPAFLEEAKRYLACFPRSPVVHLIAAWMAEALLAEGDAAGAAASIDLSERTGLGIWSHEHVIRDLRRLLEHMQD